MLNSETFIMCLASLVLLASCAASSPETVGVDHPGEETPAQPGAARTQAQQDPNKQTSSPMLLDMLPEEHRAQLEMLQISFESCDDGDSEACGQLAEMYAAGNEVPPSPQAARAYFEKTCTEGNHEECRQTARKLRRHDHLAQIVAQKLEWACNEGADMPSCIDYGMALATGRGVERDSARAVELLREGCSAGNNDACSALIFAVTAAPAESKPVKLAEFVSILDTNCERGHGESCQVLGEFYIDGVKWGEDDEIAPDAERAEQYYDEAGLPMPGEAEVTVYSKPSGMIVIDGRQTTRHTPGTVQISAGKHDVSVQFDSGDRSEIKRVSARKKSRIKLFFRQK